jgi:predicted transcriptional regulator
MQENKPTADKDRFTTTLDVDLLQKIKILAIYEKCSANVLIEEAIHDLLLKYEKRKAAEEQKRRETQKSLFDTE